MIKERFNSQATNLVNEYQVRVRFNDCDPLQVVWHGNYITYFEDGREAFNRSYGIPYMKMFDEGFATPVVKSYCEHKLFLKYEDVATVRTTFYNTPAAKIHFKYEVFNQHKELVCTGETVQVFTNKEGQLSLSIPDFFRKWKEKLGLE
ncbi:MAG: acyl-CoA thioesterase [Mesonia sp.]|uniref:acyl-CoA thioesterase n=1 Tax=Mesonia sp. TaxID=1960830 RepID=UPI003F9D769E